MEFIKVVDAIISKENIKGVYFKEHGNEYWVFIVDSYDKQHNIVEGDKNFDYAYGVYNKIIKNFKIVLDFVGE